MSAGRILVGNLDCELSWRGGGPASRAALATASAFATLLRVLAAAGDQVWTPQPVAAERLADVAGLALPRICSGPLTRCAGADRILAWGETREVAALRRRAAARRRPTGAAAGEDLCGTLQERFWRLPTTTPAIAAQVNHRRYGFELARSLGCAIPASAWVERPEALRQHLRTVGKQVGDWVVKAPLSSAGRDRCVVRQGEATSHLMRRVDRLIDHSGGALFEPWLPRYEDLGGCGLVAEHQVVELGIHRQRIGQGGRFQGVTIEPGGPRLAGDFAAVMRTVMRQVGEQLRLDGYRGPFSVDSFLYRDSAGRSRLHPLCEINARMSFGLLARLFAEGEAGGEGRRTVDLRLSTHGPIPNAPSTVAILNPTVGQPAAAWLTVA